MRMGGLLKFCSRTLIGGVLFLLPVALIVFLVGQLVVVVEPVAGEALACLRRLGTRMPPLAAGTFRRPSAIAPPPQG